MQLQASTSNEKPKSHYKSSNKNQRGRALRFPGPLVNFDRLSLLFQLTTSSRAGLTPRRGRRVAARQTSGSRLRARRGEHLLPPTAIRAPRVPNSPRAAGAGPGGAAGADTHRGARGSGTGSPHRGTWF